MDSEIFKNIVLKVTEITKDEWLDFEQYFSVRMLVKNEFLWKEGDLCDQLVFVQNGLLYCYHEKDTREIVTSLYFENAIFYDDYSFITQKPGMKNYVALEPTELIVVPRIALYEMFDRYKSFERLGRMMVEINHAKALEDQLNFTKTKAEEKYLSLLDSDPAVLRRVPLKIIAAYLHVTAEHLSRIRKKISKAKSSNL